MNIPDTTLIRLASALGAVQGALAVADGLVDSVSMNPLGPIGMQKIEWALREARKAVDNALEALGEAGSQP